MPRDGRKQDAAWFIQVEFDGLISRSCQKMKSVWCKDKSAKYLLESFEGISQDS